MDSRRAEGKWRLRGEVEQQTGLAKEVNATYKSREDAI